MTQSDVQGIARARKNEKFDFFTKQIIINQ